MDENKGYKEQRAQNLGLENHHTQREMGFPRRMKENGYRNRSYQGSQGKSAPRRDINGLYSEVK